MTTGMCVVNWGQCMCVYFCGVQCICVAAVHSVCYACVVCRICVWSEGQAACVRYGGEVCVCCGGAVCASVCVTVEGCV